MYSYSNLAKSLIDRAVSSVESDYQLFAPLFVRLQLAPAPSGGCLSLNAAGAIILAMSLTAELPARVSNGNIYITLGKQSKPRSDLLICSHMDRPSFRVEDLDSARLYPLCAIRTPTDEYSCRAIAIRYSGKQVEVTSQGEIRIARKADSHDIRYHANEGALGWGDTVLMHNPLSRTGDTLTGSGLDNASGVLVNLMFARLLHACSDELTRNDVQIICAFTDQEEGPPEGLFGQGAARLTRDLPPPTAGFINIDAHNSRSNGGGARLGSGISHAFVSGRGRGSVVPLNFQDVAERLSTLDDFVNLSQINYGYVSRSDDMLLSLWSRCLGLVGVPLENAHTAEETIHFLDLLSAQRWLAAFVPLALDQVLS